MNRKLKRRSGKNVSAECGGAFNFRQNSPQKSRQKGFTLTELAIVIAVIAILIAVLVPTFTSIINKAKESAAEQDSANNYKNYVIGDDFYLDAPLTDYYDIISIEDPELLTTYNENKERHGSGESQFYNTADYYVGDDNEFIFEPILTVRHKVTYEIMTLTNFDTEVTVSIYNDGQTSPTSLTGEPIDDTTIGYYDESNSNTLYVTYNTETYGFDFVDDVATGKSFTISMSLKDPYVDPDTGEQKDLNKDYIGNTITASEMTVTVADGWNVYNALDLGRMCVVANGTTVSKDTYYRAQSIDVSTYNGTSIDSNSNLNYSSMWAEFLAAKFPDETLTAVNGIYIHANITVTNDDIPAGYIVTAEEAAAKTSGPSYNYNYSDMVGSIRDWSLLYIHYMTDNFDFNGNLFKLDFSNLKWGMTNTSADGYYYVQNASTKYAGHSTAFAFAGAKTGGTYTVNFSNVESTGNTNGVLNGSDSDGINASGSLMFVKSIHTNTKVGNCITKNYLIGYFTEICTASFKGLEISNTKIYDCYNSAVFAWQSPNNTITNSTMKRFGGSAVMLVGGQDSEQTEAGKTVYTAGGFTITSSTITNEVTGGEAWFALNNATDAATELIGLDSDLNKLGKTFLTSSKALNLYALVLDDDYLGSDTTTLFANFAYNLGTNCKQLYLTKTSNTDDDTINNISDSGGTTIAGGINSFITEQNNSNTSKKTPVFMTDTGKLFITDGNGNFYDLSSYSSNPTSPTAITSDDLTSATTLYVFYPMNNTLVGLAVQLNTYSS